MGPVIIKFFSLSIFFQENLLKMFFKNKLILKNEGWKKLNYYWIYFFLFVATLNEIIWRTQSELFWVNFKVWGMLPITFIFTAFQVKLITRYKVDE